MFYLLDSNTLLICTLAPRNGGQGAMEEEDHSRLVGGKFTKRIYR